jgi:replicative DNA helicase
LVSEGADKLTGNEAIDKTMNDLLRFVKRHNVWIGLVSHLRKTVNTGKAFEEGRMPNLDDIKGSGSIKQISFDIFAFARNLMDDDPVARNTIEMAVLKSRHTGLTGSAGTAYYDYQTGRFMQEAPMGQFMKVAHKTIDNETGEIVF